MSAPVPPPSSPPARTVDDCWNRIGVRGDGTCPELPRQVHCRNCPVYSAAAVRLLDTELPEGHLDDWAEHFAVAPVTAAPGTRTVLVFRLGAERLALSTSCLHEVCESRGIHSLPHRRNGVVRGLANLHGSLLVVVSLGAVLGLPAARPGGKGSTQPHWLVVGRNGRRLVVPVDEVLGFHRCAPGELLPVPATVAHATPTYTEAIFGYRDHTVGCLDDSLLFHTLERSLA